MKAFATSAAVKNTKNAARKSLRDSMGAVAAALSATPDNVVRMPKNISEMFLLVDPVLSMIHRQLLDARSHVASVALMLGAGDPMMDALNMQIASLEQAYAERLAALKRRREESRARRAKKEDNKFTKVEVKNLSCVRGQLEKQTPRNGILWSWIFLLLLANQASIKTSGPRLEAA